MVKMLFYLVCLFCPLLLSAQQALENDRGKVLHAAGIASSLKIDGLLNEPEWAHADSASRFVQIDPYQGRPAVFSTSVRVLYNENYIYVGVVCYDSSGRKGVRVTELYRDFSISKNDVFSFCIDAFNDRRNNMTFAANPYGAQYDYLSFDAQLTDSDWNGLWKVRTSIQPYGWVAEFEIPWKTLRYRNTASSEQEWGINFYRQRRFSNEVSAWSPYTRSLGFNRMEFAGTLSSLNPPAPSANIQISPYALFSKNRSRTPGLDNSRNKVKAGGQIKWAINSNSVLDLTVNTDFAQANADIAVNNITRFSVLFPERRQFFLENASLFSPGLNGTGGSMYIFPFFSRTIGLDNGVPIPIEAGARFVNRSPKQNFGGLLIQQAETGRSPRTHYGVVRYSRNFAAQNRIGGLVTMKSAGAHGGKPSNTNITGMVDGFLRLDKNNTLSMMAVHASNSQTGKTGIAGYIQYLYTTNAIQAWHTQSIVSKHYKNEMGFVSREDVICTSPGFFTNLRGKWLPFKKYVRAVQPDLTAEFYHQASTGQLIERTITIYPIWVSLHSGGFFGYSFAPTYQLLMEPFAPLGITINPGSYRYNRSTFYVNSDPSKKISYAFTYDIGKYFDGGLRSTTASLALSPIPHIFLKLSWTHNSFAKIGPDETSAKVSLYTAEGRFALNPRLQLNGLFQHNTQNKQTAFYIRLSWEYKPLSYLFFVFNNKETDTIDQYHEQDGIVKVSYLKQF